MAKPLTELLKKDRLFVWTSVHASAFQLLKNALSTTPVLALPDFSIPFHIETDASGTGIGAVLLQRGHPLAFISKPLSPKNRGLTVYEKEYLVILMAVDAWRHYLLQAEFFIHTDHQSLTHLNEQRLHTAWQQKVFSRLLGLQYKILYRKGNENGVADALSRRQHPEQLLSVSSIKHQWLEQVVTGYQTDPRAMELLQRLAVQQDSTGPFSFLPVSFATKAVFGWAPTRRFNSWFSRLFMLNQSGGTPEHLLLTSASNASSFGRNSRRTSGSLCSPVLHVYRRSLIVPSIQGSSNHCLFPRNHGRWCRWTSSKAYRPLELQMQSWWWLINTLSLRISYRSVTRSRQQQWPRYSLNIFTTCTAYPSLSFRTGIVSSPVSFGYHYSSWLVQHSASAQPTIRRPMAKPSE